MFGAVLLAFGIGFVAGIATIQALLPPAGPGRPPATQNLAARIEPGGGGDLALGGFITPAPVEVRSSRPEAAPAPARSVTVAADPATAPIRLAALTSEAHAGAEAGPRKRTLDHRPASVEQFTVRRGDTLANLLARSGVEPTEAHAAIASLREIYDPRRLREGQELVIAALDGEPGRELVELSFDLSFDHEIHVRRSSDGAFAATKVARKQHSELVRRAGTIDDSLYLSAERDALPRGVLLELIKLFSWDVDFQRDIRSGDAYELVFEEVSLEDHAGSVRGGDLLFARLALSGRELAAYRFERADGTVEFFDRAGESIRKFLLRTPVDGARLTSRFGMRRHPILGYSRMHKGIDFAAPTGTPIFAAGNGRIASAGRNGGYGNYVRIEHTNEFATAYAHLSRIGKGIRPGARVEQGQVIGYVGTTGRSTGPHLHYEVLRHGAQTNPLDLEQPPTARLAGAELERFVEEMARIDELRTRLSRGVMVASKVDRQRGVAN